MNKEIKVPPHFPPIIIPICIYHRRMSGELQGYLGTPAVTIGENNIETVSCISPEIEYEGWYKAGSFYAMNPMYLPIPSDMILLCAKQSNTGEKSYNTIHVKDVYDPFHIEDDCVYFLTWTVPKPYTTPIFLYHSGGGVLPSFVEQKDMEPAKIPVMYVLTDEPTVNTIFPYDNKKWFEKWKDGSPNFLYKSYMGSCIPDPEGEPLEKCILKHDVDNIAPMSLLDYLKGNKNKIQGIKNVLEVVDKNNSRNIIIGCILLGFFLLLIAYIVYAII